MAAPTHAPDDLMNPYEDAESYRGKPPEMDELESLELRMTSLDEGDYELLAKIIAEHPHLREQLIEIATRNCGSQCVGRALAILAGAQEQGAQGGAAGPVTLSDDLMEPSFDETPEQKQPEASSVEETEAAPQGGALTSDERHFIAEGGSDEDKIAYAVETIRANPGRRAEVFAALAEWANDLVPFVIAELAEAPAQEEKEDQPPSVTGEAAPREEEKKPAKDEASWIVRARAYNKAHPALCDRFVDLTMGECLGDDAELDPCKVSDWQAAHGVPPDGRVGEKTVAAAEKSIQPEIAPEPMAAEATAIA